MRLYASQVPAPEFLAIHATDLSADEAQAAFYWIKQVGVFFELHALFAA